MQQQARLQWEIGRELDGFPSLGVNSTEHGFVRDQTY